MDGRILRSARDSKSLSGWRRLGYSLRIGIRELQCWLIGCRYYPVYETRQWNFLNGRYHRKEFRLHCVDCGKPTRWFRWKFFDKVMQDLNVRW